MKKILLILNPTSGKLTSRTALFDITQIFCEAGWLVTTRITLAAGQAAEISFEAEKSGEYDLIVCCGGDGTLNEVINGVIRSGGSTPIGYIPAGSTNDFASSMKIPTDLLLAAKNITECNHTVEIDAGNFNNDRIFTYIASFGAFTSTSYSVPQNIKNTMGHFAYVLAGIKDVTAIKPYPVTVQANGETYSGEYIFGAVCNSFSVGGIIKLDTETVSLNDGKFEVLLVKQPKNAVQLQKILWGLINNNFTDKEVFDLFKASKIELSLPDSVDWSLDGEHEKGAEKVVIENLPSAVKLWYATT